VASLVFAVAQSLALLPFLPALLGAGSAGPRRGVFVFGFALVQAVAAWVTSFTVLTGNVFTARSLLDTGLRGAKPMIYPEPLFLGLELATLVTVGVLVWRYRALPAGSAVLFLLAAGQLVPLAFLSYIPFDRYYMVVTFPLVPVAAAMARSGRSLWAGLAMALAFQAAVAVGEQDYQAWQVARDRAARLAYRQASPLEVQAGYEANGVYGEVPVYDRTGRLLSGLARRGGYDFSQQGPIDPVLELRFAPPDDPRPGVAYSSAAPGKVVISRPSEPARR